MAFALLPCGADSPSVGRSPALGTVTDTYAPVISMLPEPRGAAGPSVGRSPAPKTERTAPAIRMILKSLAGATGPIFVSHGFQVPRSLRLVFPAEIYSCISSVL